MSARIPHEYFYLHRLAATPLVALDFEGLRVWAKLEFLNPSGSTKDRIARYILEKAWREGRLCPDSTVVEASSGSTSIAMALASAQLGVKFIAVMPEGVSSERVWMIRAYGGEIRLSPKAEGIRGAIAETERIAGANPRAFLPRQFTNIENAHAHREATAREILDQIPGGTVDAVASGVGTGGTLVGLQEGFAEHGCSCTPYYARPVNLYQEGDLECCSYSARIPGVVECISTIFQESALPGLRTVEVRDEEALVMTRRLQALGFPVGPSSGLNTCAALTAARELGPQAQVVTVFPDRMERYFSTELFTPMK